MDWAGIGEEVGVEFLGIEFGKVLVDVLHKLGKKIVKFLEVELEIFRERRGVLNDGGFNEVAGLGNQRVVRVLFLVVVCAACGRAAAGRAIFGAQILR